MNEKVEQYYASEIRHGQLNPDPDTLVKKGLVKKGQHDLRTNKYVLTDHGEREIEARLAWELTYIPDVIAANVDDNTTEVQSD